MIDDISRDEWPRVVASLSRRFGDLDIAEEAAGEAFLAAVSNWGETGTDVPANPGGWLITTATRKAIDRIRRDHRRLAKYEDVALLHFSLEPTTAIEDDQLRLIFTCTHPALALALAARLALTLRLVAGLTVDEISRTLLSSEAAIVRRITRAKAKIRDAHIPFVVHEPLNERLDDVLAVIYLIFNEGYLPGGAAELRVDLSDEAIRLACLVHGLLPDEPEPAGLLALLLLIDSRCAARIDETGALVTLEAQDRSAWDGALIAEGHSLVRLRRAQSPRALPAPSGDQRRPHGRTDVSRHRLVGARHAVRPAIRNAPFPGGRAQSRRGHRRVGRSGGGVGRDREAAA